MGHQRGGIMEGTMTAIIEIIDHYLKKVESQVGKVSYNLMESG
jgi:hypothetical protein